MANNEIILWRYDPRELFPNDMIYPEPSRADDFLVTLTPDLLVAEKLICEAVPNGAELRRNAVYCFEDRGNANEGAYRKAVRLYEVAVDQNDILHRGDLNHYTQIGQLAAGKTALSKGPADHTAREVLKYWASEVSRPNSKMEVLVKQARVVAEHAVEASKHTREPLPGYNPFDLSADPTE